MGTEIQGWMTETETEDLESTREAVETEEEDNAECHILQGEWRDKTGMDL